MNDELTALLDRAAPGAVAPLDLDRAQREGQARARRRTTTGALTSTVAVASAALILTGWLTESDVSIDPVPGAADVAAEQLAAGCISVPVGDLESTDHFDPRTAPSADAIYETPLPAWGPHLPGLIEVRDGIPDLPLDVRSVVHNLEHGAIAIWLDPSQLSADIVLDIETWVDTRRALGFAQGEGGGADLIVSPVPNGVEGVAPISLRAWGVAIDCARWNAVVADAFVSANYGTRGTAPEGRFGRYPSPDPLG